MQANISHFRPSVGSSNTQNSHQQFIQNSSSFVTQQTFNTSDMSKIDQINFLLIKFSTIKYIFFL
jgi:hypothetical protein